VNDEDPDLLHIECRMRRKRHGPIAGVVIAAHDRQRRNRRQGIQHGLIADVAGVKDRVASREPRQRFGTHEIVRIRNQTDA
jgi:hypothetical protein